MIYRKIIPILIIVVHLVESFSPAFAGDPIEDASPILHRIYTKLREKRDPLLQGAQDFRPDDLLKTFREKNKNPEAAFRFIASLESLIPGLSTCSSASVASSIPCQRSMQLTQCYESARKLEIKHLPKQTERKQSLSRIVTASCILSAWLLPLWLLGGGLGCFLGYRQEHHCPKHSDIYDNGHGYNCTKYQNSTHLLGTIPYDSMPSQAGICFGSGIGIALSPLLAPLCYWGYHEIRTRLENAVSLPAGDQSVAELDTLIVQIEEEFGIVYLKEILERLAFPIQPNQNDNQV